jgi:hypothetical protein
MLVTLLSLAALAQEPAPLAPEAPVAVEAPTSESDAELLRRLQERIAELEAKQAEMEAAAAPAVAPEPVSSGARVSYTGDVAVEEGEVVDEVAAYGYDVIVEGRVLGDATSFGGDVVVVGKGKVDGDATSFGGEVVVEDGGVVRGDRVSFADDADYEDAGTIAGALSSLYHRVVLLLSFAGAGVLLVGLVPSRITRIAEMVEEHPFGTFAAGVLATAFLGIGSLLFAITILGLPIAFLLLAVLGLAWLMGFVGLCQALGDRLPFQQKHHGRWLAFLIGTVVVTFLGFLPLFGWFLVGVASVIGIGAAVASAFGSR